MSVRRYRIYVLEVVREDERGKPPRVYVGQTALSIRERVRQHAVGKRYCASCTRRHYVSVGARMRPRPDLARRAGARVTTTRQAAEREERRVARVLRRAGHRVYGGH